MTFNGGCMPFKRGCKPFPVVYCDGQSKTYIGDVMVFATTNLKRILPILSEKIGIAHHQLSVFIADKNSSRTIPFQGSLNIAAVTHHGGAGAYYFYVKLLRRRIKISPMKNKNLSERVMHQSRDRAVDGTNCNHFLMSMGYTVDPFSRKMVVGNRGGCRVAECKECIMAHMSRTVADFHLCAHDEVIVGFRTSAAPISRPVRNTGENGN